MICSTTSWDRFATNCLSEAIISKVIRSWSAGAARASTWAFR